MRGRDLVDSGGRLENQGPPDYEPAARSPWVWGLGALIAIVFSVNMLLVYVAVATSPGLVSEDYYERGKSFASRARLRDGADKNTGWRLSITSPEKYEFRNNTAFTLRAAAADGSPLEPAVATLFAYRPSDSSADFSIRLKSISPGEYGAKVAFPLPGAWDVIVEVEHGGRKTDAAKRLFISGTPD